MTSATCHGRRGPRAAVLATVGLTVLLLPLAGCGSSKPSYCAKEAELKSSVKALGEVNVLQGGTNAVTTALKKVETSATGLVEAAKSEFPTQTEAIDSSLTALMSSAKQLSSSPTDTSVISKIPGQVAALGSAVTGFTNATSSKCS
jgi:hypothetical protein